MNLPPPANPSESRNDIAARYLQHLQIAITELKEPYNVHQVEWWALNLAWEAIRLAWHVMKNNSLENLSAVTVTLEEIKRRFR